MTAVNSALNGPGFGFDDPDVGVVLVNEVAIWGAVAFALMGIFQMARHTRAEEEAERTEVLRSRMVGRHAVLAAAAITVGGLEVVVGTGDLRRPGRCRATRRSARRRWCSPTWPPGCSSRRSPRSRPRWRARRGPPSGSASARSGVAYLVRAVGDMGGGSLSWLSPIGWVHRVRPFAGEQWWVLGLSFTVVAWCAAVVSVVLSDRRNLGVGPAAPAPGATARRSRDVAPARADRPAAEGAADRLERRACSCSGWPTARSPATSSRCSSTTRTCSSSSRPVPARVTDAYLSYTLALGAMMAGGLRHLVGAAHARRGVVGRLELMLAHPVARTRVGGRPPAGRASSGPRSRCWRRGSAPASAVAFALGDPGAGPADGRGVAGAAAGRSWCCSASRCCAWGCVPEASPGWPGSASSWWWSSGCSPTCSACPDWVRWMSPLDHLPQMPAAGFDAVAVRRWSPRGGRPRALVD